MWKRPDSQEVGLEAATLQRKRNSSLVKRIRAENVTGLKRGTEATGLVTIGRGVFSERYAVYRQGALTAQRRAYAGMSSDKPGRKPGRRKPKVSWGRISLPWVSRDLSRGREA
jgi:hypothetical protein